jgi:hypothetical protein
VPQVLIIVTLAIALPGYATAAMIYQTVTFDAPKQSLWGGGGSGAGFSSSGSAGGFDYSVGASSGEVWGTLGGNLAIYYRDVVTPGVTTVKVGFNGFDRGGRIQSDLGAWLNVDFLGISLLDYDYRLDPVWTDLPSIGRRGTARDETLIGGVSTGIPGLWRFGLGAMVDQTNRFQVGAINGFMGYSRVGSGVNHVVPFSLAGDSGIDLPATLLEPGQWDFWLYDLSLANTFSASFDARFTLWSQNRGCGFLGLRWCRRNSANLAQFDLYDPRAFSLDFTEISRLGTFSMRVVPSIPEPGSFALLALGLAGLGLTRRRRA